jgi:hypothetical protein
MHTIPMEVISLMVGFMFLDNTSKKNQNHACGYNAQNI